ncbi:hypothetical protein [Mesorhizobium sp.]|uniref:hypothetical protein n=1 Tax=Mesorhizobium sp. TaxID=1871066 RepID=UPI000FE89093|nr:hypothetical protein [Mesorhizobium sp.]RWK42467.1 MAG: hypothetical protein EOR46_11645 [Mesorhizobium sp.]RWK69509.1 MAG: hypothetical protein EOR54_09230 [Mesorhizobium sp.]RWK79726.1 MAG: hypothetical protein EOR50_06335 [Mesorhizobium sp.]RWK82502.1 MAG: hypothetical protein EOR51_12605 [Mesorhizobium sp.]RWL08679.1 MAG: hypothetical protein EOR55_02945 [Mesorhizobium sp.]
MAKTAVRRGLTVGKRAKTLPKAAAKMQMRRLARIDAVLQRAEESGLRAEKNGRIAGRVSADLIKKAKARTGLTSDTELVEFALANVALEDNFAETFRKTRGTVDPTLKLGF